MNNNHAKKVWSFRNYMRLMSVLSLGFALLGTALLYGFYVQYFNFDPSNYVQKTFVVKGYSQKVTSTNPKRVTKYFQGSIGTQKTYLLEVDLDNTSMEMMKRMRPVGYSTKVWLNVETDSLWYKRPDSLPVKLMLIFYIPLAAFMLLEIICAVFIRFRN